MEKTFKRGDAVKVRAYGGEVLKRKVGTDAGRTVIVSAEAEFKLAVSEGREPDVGFPKRDVSAA